MYEELNTILVKSQVLGCCEQNENTSKGPSFSSNLIRADTSYLELKILSLNATVVLITYNWHRNNGRFQQLTRGCVREAKLVIQYREK